MAIPAQPLLASELWIPQNDKPQPLEASTNVTDGSSVDDILKNCIKCGTITCVSTQPNIGENEPFERLLASHLLESSSNSQATLIDTNSSVDMRNIHGSIKSRLSIAETSSKEAVSILERLKIMKVFDFQGLADALSELRHSFESGGLRSPADEQQPMAPPRSTVEDSEDEDEMLDDLPASVAEPSVTESATVSPSSSALVLIDNLSHVMSPILKSNHAHGQALMVSFLRSLWLLTKEYNIRTIVVNNTTSYSHNKEDSPSIFSSCIQRPLLGKSIAHLFDGHLLLHQLESGASTRTSQIDPNVVVEVIHSRNGDDHGRWASTLPSSAHTPG
jgi:hypothetical protein